MLWKYSKLQLLQQMHTGKELLHIASIAQLLNISHKSLCYVQEAPSH